MTDLSTEEIYRAVGEIISEFKLYECAECAEAILAWADEEGISDILLP
jgi:hypothetical protein